MPADLDHLFSAMGAHADSVSAAPPESVRRRGNQRRRNRVTFICAALVLLVGSAATISQADHGRGTPPAAPTPHPTASFTTITPVGAGLPMPLGASGSGMASVSGSHLFAVGVTEQHRGQLGASDLTTGRPLWPTVDIGLFDYAGLYVKGDAILVVGAHQTGPNPTYVVMVFDADTGAKRWEVGPTDLTMAIFDAVVVVRSATEHAVLGLDWSTGEQRWRIPLADGDLSAVVQNMTAPHSIGLSVGYWPDIADQRLYLIQTDGTVRIYLGNTGVPVSTLANSAPRTTGTDEPTYVVDDNVLYAVSRSTEVWVADLGGTPNTSTLVFNAPSGSNIRSVTPCGVGQVCLITDNGNDEHLANTELIAVDRATHTISWRRAAPGAQHAAATSDRILTDRGQLFDMSGHPLGGDAALDAFWVTPGSALILRRADFTDIHSDISVVGLSTVDGAERPLGQIPQVRGTCTRTAQVLVCPASDGFHVWRFAAG
jgi:outer membrane protein assembly factor BamB